MLPPLGTTGHASISDVTGWGGGCSASRAGGGGDLLLVQKGREAPRGGAAEFVHGFVSVCGGRSSKFVLIGISTT